MNACGDVGLNVAFPPKISASESGGALPFHEHQGNTTQNRLTVLSLKLASPRGGDHPGCR